MQCFCFWLSVSFGFAEAAQNEEILSSSSGAESSSSFYAGQAKDSSGYSILSTYADFMAYAAI